MHAFERLLVPVDFSAHSTHAVRVAAGLAQRFDGMLMLAHVYDPLVYSLPDGFTFMVQSQLDRLFAAVEAELARAKGLAMEAGARRVESQLVQGPVASEIVDLAACGKFDLIVMGTHGRTGLRHLVIGSIAERVVRLATCPVLTVKAQAAATD